jgi:hypothetical protein
VQVGLFGYLICRLSAEFFPVEVPKSSGSKTSRISTSESRVWGLGQRLTHPMASSRDLTCQSQKPATSSLVSAKWPSVKVRFLKEIVADKCHAHNITGIADAEAGSTHRIGAGKTDCRKCALAQYVRVPSACLPIKAPRSPRGRQPTGASVPALLP